MGAVLYTENLFIMGDLESLNRNLNADIHHAANYRDDLGDQVWGARAIVPCESRIIDLQSALTRRRGVHSQWLASHLRSPLGPVGQTGYPNQNRRAYIMR